VKLTALTGKYITTFLAVGTALLLAFASGPSGNGALKLWPLFGAVNQTLAGLALIIITVYLKDKGGVKWLISGIPALFMMVMTIWALILNQTNFGTAHNVLLQVVNAIILILAVWITVEGVVRLINITPENPIVSENR
jgi:carbon starvation protein